MRDWVRRGVWLVLRVLLPAAVVVGVGWHFYRILKRPELWEQPWSLRAEWLLPAALLYLLAHCCWGSFWVALLRSQGQEVSLPVGLRAYFVSQYGKYVPGKVWVILIRVAMLGRGGASRAVVGLTATFETLTSMAAGALLGAILLPLLGIEIPGLAGQTYLLALVAGVPLGLAVLNRLLSWLAKRYRGPDAKPLPTVGLLMLLRGLVQTSVGWSLLGLSLWLTVRSVVGEAIPFDGETLLRLTAINCFAYVAGFLFLFMPGGVGVRELVLQTMLARELQPLLTDAPAADGLAAVVALVLRLAWTLAEVLLALTLQRYVHPAPKGPPE